MRKQLSGKTSKMFSIYTDLKSAHSVTLSGLLVLVNRYLGPTPFGMDLIFTNLLIHVSRVHNISTI